MSRHTQLGVHVAARPQAYLDPCAGQTVEHLEGQQRVTSWPYYSTVKFRFVRSGASGSYIYTLNLPNRGLRAFGYALGETKETAGFTTTDGQATAADTNLVTKNQTISGQHVEIRGIAFQWHNASVDSPDAQNTDQTRYVDGNALALLNRVISAEVGLNGDENTFKLGTIGMVPGAGGLRGGAPLLSGLNVLDGNQDTNFAANGWETRGNFFKMPEGLVWKTSDSPDGNLNVIFRQQGAAIIAAGGSPENNAFAVDSAPIADISMGYDYPAYIIAELKVFLIGMVVGGRTRSA